MQKKYKRSSKKDDSASGEGNSDGAAAAGVRFFGNSTNVHAKPSSSSEIFEVNYSTSGGSAICSTLNSASAPRIKDPIFKSNQQSALKQNQHRHRSRSNTGSRKTLQSNESEIITHAATQTVTSMTGKRTKTTDEYEFEILSLNAQLEEHKKKEMELHRDKDKLNKLVEHYEKTNKDLSKKIEEINRNSALRDLPNRELQYQNIDVDQYKLELRKRDEQIQ
jgi:hypothetical protein